MTRRRVNLTLLPNENARKVTYKKRTQGLTKKMEEITTLCGVDGCIVIYKPEEAEPHVWPSKEKAADLLTKYENMPKTDQDNIKKLDHEKFMADRVEKLRENIAKREKKNKEAQASLLMHEMSLGRKMEDLNIAEVELLIWYSDMKLKEIKRQNILLPPTDSPTRVSSPQPPPPAPYLPPVQPPQAADKGVFVGGSTQGGGDSSEMEVENDPFYMEMFRSTTAGGYSVGANGMWRGQSSNGNQQNNDMDFQYGFENGSSSSFPGFP